MSALDASTPTANYVVCDTCDIGALVQGHSKALMQAVTNDVQEYNMRLTTTKCLNVAVMIMFLMMGGEDGLRQTRYCDVPAVIGRVREHKYDRASIMQGLKHQILQQTTPRMLFYVLLTDGWFPSRAGMNDAEAETEHAPYFPGHVFVVDKPAGAFSVLRVYQAYIHNYDLEESMQRPDSYVSVPEMATILDALNHTMAVRTWLPETARVWTRLTGVPTGEFLYRSARNTFVCYKALPVRTCVRSLDIYVQSKLRQLVSLPPETLGDIYGNTSLYDDDASPLTNREMRIHLSSLRLNVARYVASPSCRKVFLPPNKSGNASVAHESAGSSVDHHIGSVDLSIRHGRAPQTGGAVRRGGAVRNRIVKDPSVRCAPARSRRAGLSAGQHAQEGRRSSADKALR
jgi:hypothetical protein